MSIELRNLEKKFGNFQALLDINLRVEAGELVALLGPSGCGKTTLLRILAGLEFPDAGQILIDEQDVTGQNVQERRMGFVFQHYALFKHMTIAENIAFGLKVAKGKNRLDPRQIEDKVRELLALIHLEGLSGRYPSQLSGGQRQRVALARALAVNPRVLLLDEPFGALDYKVRKQLRRWLRDFHNDLQVTSIFVTHDQEEALEVADKVVVMNHGRIEQIGAPDDIYSHPANPFVYDFLGDANIFHGRIKNGEAEVAGLRFAAPGTVKPENAAVKAYTRPHDIEIDRAPLEGGIPAKVVSISPLGHSVRVELKRADDSTIVEAQLIRKRQQELNLQSGDEVFLRFEQPRIFIDSLTA